MLYAVAFHTLVISFSGNGYCAQKYVTVHQKPEMISFLDKKPRFMNKMILTIQIYCRNDVLKVLHMLCHHFMYNILISTLTMMKEHVSWGQNMIGSIHDSD